MHIGKATFAAVLGMAVTIPAGAADRMQNYEDSLKCASLHVIAGQVLSQDSGDGGPIVDRQADTASTFFSFAQAQRPDLSKAEVDADLMAQMDKDYSAITAEGADYAAFLTQRKALCAQLKTKI